MVSLFAASKTGSQGTYASTVGLVMNGGSCRVLTLFHPALLFLPLAGVYSRTVGYIEAAPMDKEPFCLSCLLSKTLFFPLRCVCRDGGGQAALLGLVSQ